MWFAKRIAKLRRLRVESFDEQVTHSLFELAGGPRSTVLGEPSAAFLCNGSFPDLRVSGDLQPPI